MILFVLDAFAIGRDFRMGVRAGAGRCLDFSLNWDRALCTVMKLEEVLVSRSPVVEFGCLTGKAMSDTRILRADCPSYTCTA
jgi:hypothetical protein